MSAMLESYDMQMHDYSTDIDIQMHTSSNDQWFHDETKMEEDLPHRTDPSMKADQYDLDKSDFPIEVEMDSSLLDPDAHVNEYEMLDGEFMHETVSTELVDVEVLDASLVHTPSVLPVEMHNLDSTPAPQFSLHDVSITSQSSSVSIPHLHTIDTSTHPITNFQEITVSRPDAESSSVKPTESYDIAVVDAPSTPSTILHEHNPAQNTDSSQQENTSEEPTVSFGESHHHQPVTQEWTEQTEEDPQNRSQHADDLQPEVSDVADDPVIPQTDDGAPYNDIPDSSHDQHDDAENLPAQSSGDPHEISEGVFIEPPPPVIMSLPQTDLHVTFFNPSKGEVHEGTPVIFQHLPTLYYEPLPTVFEALRQESIIHNLPGIDEAELVMDILSLQLRISEDNIYSRDMSLHDLNVLHDAAGLSGSLHISTTTSSPRFIVQYHRLQSSIQRSNQEESTDPQPNALSNAPPDTELPEASTEQPSEDVVRSVEDQDDQNTEFQNNNEGPDGEDSGQNVYDSNEQTQSHEVVDVHAEVIDGGEVEQNHDDQHERPELSGENGGDGAVNDVQEGAFDQTPAIPDTEEVEETEVHSVHQQEAISGSTSNHVAGQEQHFVDNTESSNVDERNYGRDTNQDEANEDPDDDGSSDGNALDEDSSFEEEGEILEEDVAAVAFHGADVDDNGEASSVEDEDESYYELGHVAEEPVTDVAEVIPLEALEPVDEDGLSERHHTSTLGSRDSSPSSSGGDAQHSSDDVAEAGDKDDFGQDELHAGDDGGVAADLSNLDAVGNDALSDTQIPDTRSDLHENIYSDQQDFTEGLLQADLDVPDLPDEPIAFEDWDADGDFEYEDWDETKDHSATLSNNESTTTLSSKSSKRTFEEVEDSENYGDWAPASSPDPKRTRTL